MKIRHEFVPREIAGEFVLVPVGKSAIELSGMIFSNGVGAFLMEMLKEDQTEDSLIAGLLEEYEVDAETAAKDVHEFMDKLTTIGIVEQ